MHKMHHNSTGIAKDHIKHLKTYTATFTAMVSSSYIMTDSTSAEMTFDIFTMSSCTECITSMTMTETFGSGLITLSVTNTAMSTATATPYYMYSTMVTSVPYMAASAPSAGFATTSLAVFMGSGGRRSVDYFLVATLPIFVGLAM
jgi:hypothetical protein